jgi:hypothetical protein
MGMWRLRNNWRYGLGCLELQRGLGITTTISPFQLTILRIQDCCIGSDLAKSRMLLLLVLIFIA